MSLYSELREDVADILSDPDIRTGDIKIHRISSTTEAANPWEDSTDVLQVIQLDAVAFTQLARYAAGTLVAERGDQLTISAIATVVEEDAVAVNRKIILEIEQGDVILVDGDVRQIISKIRIPATGDVTAWSVLVAD